MQYKVDLNQFLFIEKKLIFLHVSFILHLHRILHIVILKYFKSEIIKKDVSNRTFRALVLLNGTPSFSHCFVVLCL